MTEAKSSDTQAEVRTNFPNERVTDVWDGGFCTKGDSDKMYFYDGKPPENWPRELPADQPGNHH